MSEQLVTVHFGGITHIDMTYGLAIQQMQKHIDKADGELARLTALLAEAKIEVGLMAAMVPARAFSKKSDAEYIEAMGERARAVLAKLGA